MDNLIRRTGSIIYVKQVSWAILEKNLIGTQLKYKLITFNNNYV